MPLVLFSICWKLLVLTNLRVGGLSGKARLDTGFRVTLKRTLIPLNATNAEQAEINGDPQRMQPSYN
jgi:hypothetical protein